MKEVRKVIEEELKSKNSGRRAFRNYVRDGFERIIDYTEKRLEKLEERVYRPIGDSIKEKRIYSALVNKEELGSVAEGLYPYDNDDFEVNGLKGRVIATAPLMGAYSELKEIEKRRYKGTVLREDDTTYEVELRFVQNKKYQEKEERLYNIIESNGHQWETIFTPYSQRMYDLVVADEADIEGCQGIKYEIDDVEDRWMRGYYPVWNIKTEDVLSTSSPKYLGKDGLYEHRIEINFKRGSYVEPREMVIYKAHKNRYGDMVVITDEKNVGSWRIWTLEEKTEEKRLEKLKFDCVSNERRYDFVSAYSEKEGMRVRTEGELHKILKSYKELEKIALKGVAILKKEIPTTKTYDCNYYIETFLPKRDEYLLLTFEAKDKSDVLLEDRLSFARSIIDMHYPEYRILTRLKGEDE